MNLDLLPWTILFLPLLAAALITLFTQHNRKLSAGLSIGAVVAGFILSLIFVKLNGWGPARESSVAWLAVGDLQADFGLRLDPLSLLMMLIVTGVASAIHIYSWGYMSEDRGFPRYFACLSLFTFSMLGIVLANNFLELFIFWELVGVSSYLLIGFWFERPAAADAGKKAFITTRLGDFGFLLGILTVWATFHSLKFDEIEQALAANPQALGALATTAGLLIFCGAMGKSAQFPLHVWLPDAMEGPTPVSALIHAATMVAAGVYMLCRVFFLLDIPGSHALEVIAWIGGFTALLVRRHRHPAGRHQAHPGLLDALAARLHGDGRRPPRPGSGNVPSDDPCVLQGAAVPGRRLRHRRAPSRTGHLEDGRAAPEDAGHVLDLHGGHAGARGRAALQRVLQQGQHPRASRRT